MKFQIIILLTLIIFVNGLAIRRRFPRQADEATLRLEAKLMQSRLRSNNARDDLIPNGRGDEVSYGIGSKFIMKSFNGFGQPRNEPLPGDSSHFPLPPADDSLVPDEADNNVNSEDPTVETQISGLPDDEEASKIVTDDQNVPSVSENNQSDLVPDNEDKPPADLPTEELADTKKTSDGLVPDTSDEEKPKDIMPPSTKPKADKPDNNPVAKGTIPDVDKTQENSLEQE